MADAITMLHRNLLHMVRYPALTVFVIGGPVVFLLLFVFVFGGTLGAGLPGVDPAGGREAYLAYVVPGILAITIAGTAGGIATTVAMDMTEGITARFRTMAISRASVLAGHVLGNTIQAVLAVVVVLGLAVLLGFRPTAGPVEWIAAAGVIALVAFAISWIAVAMGMQTKSVETASNLPLLLAHAALPRQRLRADRVDAGGACSGSPSTSRSRRSSRPSVGCCSAPRSVGTRCSRSGGAVVIAVAGYAWSMSIYERKSVR